MSKRTPAEGFKQVEVRHGLSLPKPKGVNRQKDPGQINEQFYDLTNVRVTGSQIESRGGLTKVTTGGALTGSIVAIFDDLNG